MKIHHINIKAPRELLEKERDLFCDVLGLKQGKRPGFTSYGYWLYSGDDAVVHLSESDSHFSNDKPGYFDHVAFQEANLDDIIKALDEKGIDYSTTNVPGEEMKQIFFRTPTNTGIEVNCEN